MKSGLKKEELVEIDILFNLISSNIVRITQIFESYSSQYLLDIAINHGLSAVILKNIEGLIYAGRIQESMLSNALKTFKIFQTKDQFRQNIINQNELEILNALMLADADFVLLKGFVLNYYLYDAQNLRPKTDVDLIISKSSDKQIKEVFESNGYFNPLSWEPKYIFSQYTMRKKLNSGVNIDFDVHFKISNSKKLSKILSFSEIKEKSFLFEIDQVKYSFICKEHALIHASFHLLQHILEGNHFKAIWLYDIHLLATKFTPMEQRKLIKLIESKKIQSIVKRALEIVNNYLPSEQAQALIAGLSVLAINDDYSYLMKGKSKIRLVLADLAAMDKYVDKISYIREILFPPRSVIRKKYPLKRGVPIVMLYIWRLIVGFGKLFFK
jgi:hypothetical protein